MKAKALIPALALAAALVVPPLADASDRHRSSRGHGSSSYGYYGHRPSYGYSGHGYRPVRPYYRSHRYYAPPAYYGYGYGAYGYGGYGYGGYDPGYGYGYGYPYGYYPPPPPPPRYYRPRPRVGFWFGF